MAWLNELVVRIGWLNWVQQFHIEMLLLQGFQLIPTLEESANSLSVHSLVLLRSGRKRLPYLTQAGT